MKVALGLDDRFDLVWNGLDQVFQGFRVSPAGIYRGLKIFKISGVRIAISTLALKIPPRYPMGDRSGVFGSL
jgi:hypothetical protein